MLKQTQRAAARTLRQRFSAVAGIRSKHTLPELDFEYGVVAGSLAFFSMQSKVIMADCCSQLIWNQLSLRKSWRLITPSTTRYLLVQARIARNGASEWLLFFKTYVNNLNAALQDYKEAEESNDLQKQIKLQVRLGFE